MHTQEGHYRKGLKRQPGPKCYSDIWHFPLGLQRWLTESPSECQFGGWLCGEFIWPISTRDLSLRAVNTDRDSLDTDPRDTNLST